MRTGGKATEKTLDTRDRSHIEQLLTETGRMARIGGWEHDLETGQATWTEALHDVLEIPPEKTPGVDEHLSYYPPSDRAILKKAYDRAVAEGIPFDLELRGFTGAGKPNWWRVYGEPVYKDGKCVKLRGILHDITERKEAEEALCRSEDSFKSFLESLADVAYETDAEGNITYINKAGETATGLSREKMIGRPFLPLIADKDRSQAQENYQQCLQGQTVEIESEILSGRTLAFKSEPRYSPEGKVVGVLGIARDVTAARQAERVARESDERLKRALENIPDVVVIYDRDLRIRYVNAATRTITNRETSFFLGKRDDEIWPAEMYETYLPALRNARDTGKLCSTTVDLVIPGSGFRSLEITCVPLIDEVGNVREVIGITHDFTEQKLAHDELRKSEAHLTTLVNTLPDLVWLKDPDGVYLSCNHRFEQCLGAKIHEIVGKTDYDFVDNELADLFRKHDQAAMAVGGPLMNEEEITFASDGHKEYLETVRTPMYDSDGRLIGVLGIGRDITDRRQAEQALTESEHKYRTLFEHMMNGFALHEIVLDEAGKPIDYVFLEVNSAFEQMTGLRREEIVGKKVTEVLPGIESDPADWISRYGDVALGGKPVSFEQHSESLHKWYSVIAFSPERGRFATVFEDVTERKQAVTALVESEERFRNVVERMSDWVWETDANGVYTFASENVHEVLGYTAAEMVGKTPFDLMPPEEAERVSLLFERHASRHESIQDLENWNLHKDGHLVCLQTSGVPVFADDGRLIGFRGVDRDITERKLTEEALLESQQRFELSMKATRDGIYDWNLETNEIYFSPGWKSMLGYAEDEIENDFSEWERLTDPEGLKKSWQMLTDHLEGRLDRFELVFKMRHKEGHWVDILSRANAVFDDSGKAVRVVGTHVDITARRQAEQALRESEEMFRMLSDQSLMGIVIAQDDKFIYSNQHAAEILESTVEEMEQRPVAEFLATVHPEDREFVSEQIHKKQVGESGVVTHYTWRLSAVNGDIKWIEIWSKSILFGGRFADMITIVDITDRREAEAALRQSEEKFRELANDLPQIVFETDIDGRLMFVNDLAIEKMGYSIAELESGLMALEMIAPEDRERAGESFNRMMKGFNSSGNEYLAVRKDGTRFPIVIHSRQKVVDGKPAGLRGIIFDITERKWAEEALRASEEKLSNAMRFAKLGHWECDVAEGMFTFNDELYALLRTTAEAEGGYQMSPQRYAERFMYPEDAALVTSETQLAIETDDPNFSRRVEHRIRYADGETGHIAVQFFVVKDSSGKTVKTYGVNQDITEQVLMREEIAKADRLESVGLLAGGIAHDFNNILTAIIGNVSLAKLGIDENTEIFDCLTEAENASGRAVQLTAQLLTFAKGGAPILEATSISDIIRESAGFALRGSNVKCEFAFPEELAMVSADTGQLSQVINNLIINADQAMPEGGTIRIGAENVELPASNKFSLAAGNYVEVTIADEGTGIPAKHLSRVFDPFFTTKQKGNGLGLASVYSIIKKHKGHIAVESEVGEGTKFTIYLQAIKAKQRSRTRAADTKLVQGSGRVLVVDDEESVRRLASAILTRFGYEVEVAEEGAEGVRLYQEELARGERFAAVILDLTIPGGMGGRETIARLREIDPEVCAIVSSGYSTDPVMAEFRDYGFSGRISKPFSVTEFGKVMQEAITMVRDTV